jgi:16S rRNA (guanine(527)-N(7))-methyltransferase RsmG
MAVGQTLSVRDEFIKAIRDNQSAFDLELQDPTIERLADYYELVQKHNPLLHLVGTCPPEEFATRHILESLTLLEFLPRNGRFADVGTGAGLPSIPCLIARDDLSGVLIESKEKKARFLEEAVGELQLPERTTIIDRQFSEVRRPDVSYVTSRALDRFAENAPRLIKWSGRSTLLFFGGPALADVITKLGKKIQSRLMPGSTQRYLFIVDK